MGRKPALLLARLLALAVLVAWGPARADPADINAAARGVVRVVIVSIEGDQITPVSHGTGFAVSPERIVTNAHVVTEARDEPDLAIAIVPSDGENAVYGRLVRLSVGQDLALLATTSPMRLPALTLAGGAVPDSGPVTAVGYPMNVDRAQGLDIADLFRAQPPVKSTGFLSGRRPTRDFDSLLHTAPIARGNSGGPLLDECGRVLGVNSFGTEADGADADFYFAVSVREVAEFLREGGVTPQVNGLPCRSMQELDAEEQARADKARADADARAQASLADLARRREVLTRETEFAVLAERDNALALALASLILAVAAAGYGYLRIEAEDRRGARLGAAIAGMAVLAAAIAWFTRPGFSDIEGRVADQLAAERSATPSAAAPRATAAREGRLVCVLVPERSRVTGGGTGDVPLDWSEDGCVNGRTQYGFAGGTWSRVLVPETEAAVSVNRFDPAIGEYRIDRYLLPREDMARARLARRDITAPACGAGEGRAATRLGAAQQAVLSLLPQQPNERLVYRCSPAP